MRPRHLLVLAATGAALLVVPLAEPASAAVTASTSGTTLTIAMTGDGSAAISCQATKVAVNGVVAAPALSCSALTSVGITGDAGDQIVDLTSLGAAGFSGTATSNVVLGAGSDYLVEGPGVDAMDLGGDDDTLVLRPVGPTNTSANLGAGTGDTLYLTGTATADTIAAVSTSNTVTGTYAGTVTTSRSATNAENLYLQGNAGPDTLSSVGVTGATTIVYVSLSGNDGDDTLNGGDRSETLFGDAGTNDLHAGGNTDAIWTSSATDLIDTGDDAVLDYVYDVDVRDIGRTLARVKADDSFHVQANRSDVVSRIRPTGVAGAQRWTVSLNRSGQLTFPAGTAGLLSPSHFTSGAPNHRSIVDVVAGPRRVSGVGGNGNGGILDVTVPTGAWTVVASGPGGTTITVTPDDPAYGTISMAQTNAYRVHGPWTNKERGFVHRVTRDLLFRFATDGVLTTVPPTIKDGSVTRAAYVASLMDTDEYRGLDVDRAFQTFLRRSPDPSGRAYWINSIEAGKALWRVRAQFFGSNEYFTRAGGSNAAYVTQAYLDVLGRQPDAGGKAYWTNKLDEGADRGSVALQFINSAESRRRLVDDQFLRFLDRLPTPAEQTSWVAEIPSNDGEQRLVAFLAASASYFNRD